MAKYRVLNTYRRTIGSKNQQLVTKERWGEKEVFQHTLFYDLERDGIRYFGKKPDESAKLAAEVQQLLAMKGCPNLIKYIEHTGPYGLITEYFDGEPLSGSSWAAAANVGEFRKGMRHLYTWLKQKGHLRKIDVHGHNILVRLEANRITGWRLIDCEVFMRPKLTTSRARQFFAKVFR